MKRLRSRTAGLLEAGAMRRPRSRLRKVTVTPELVELFRKALIANRALNEDSDRAKGRMTMEQRSEALAAVSAFHRAAAHPLWVRYSPLSPEAANAKLREALLAKLTDAERRKWT